MPPYRCMLHHCMVSPPFSPSPSLPLSQVSELEQELVVNSPAPLQLELDASLARVKQLQASCASKESTIKELRQRLEERVRWGAARLVRSGWSEARGNGGPKLGSAWLWEFQEDAIACSNHAPSERQWKAIPAHSWLPAFAGWRLNRACRRSGSDAVGRCRSSRRSWQGGKAKWPACGKSCSR